MEKHEPLFRCGTGTMMHRHKFDPYEDGYCRYKEGSDICLQPEGEDVHAPAATASEKPKQVKDKVSSRLLTSANPCRRIVRLVLQYMRRTY